MHAANSAHQIHEACQEQAFPAIFVDRVREYRPSLTDRCRLIRSCGLLMIYRHAKLSVEVRCGHRPRRHLPRGGTNVRIGVTVITISTKFSKHLIANSI